MAHNNDVGAQRPRSSGLARFVGQSYQNIRGECPAGSAGIPSIKIDDRAKGDISSDFCRMSVLIPDKSNDEFTLYLWNPPLDDDVAELIDAHGGKITGSRPALEVEIALLTKEVSFLRTLAKAFRRIVGRGGRYPVPNWKWICPRTADSLDRLADRLMEYRRIRRHEPWRLRCAPATASMSQNSGGSPAGVAKDAGPSHPEDEEDIFKLLGYE
jgi:hypothetical protein